MASSATGSISGALSRKALLDCRGLDANVLTRAVSCAEAFISHALEILVYLIGTTALRDTHADI